MAESTVQRWSEQVGDRHHRVEASGSFRHHVRWYVDDRLVTDKTAVEERLTLEPDDEQRDLGRVKVVFGGMGHGRRATLTGPEGSDVPEIDLTPEAGSRAAAYEAKVREHPRRYAAIEAAVGVGKVVGGIVVALLLARLALRIPLPDWDLPSIPLPDLPSIPWPDLPSIPMPNLPAISIPGWVEWLLDRATYVVPVLVAVGLALAEIRRRREQDERRRHARDEATRDEE